MDGGLCHFSLILVNHFPHHWKDLMQYQLLILHTYCHFSGRVWLVYDRSFREHAAATRLTDWSTMNAELFKFHTALLWPNPTSLLSPQDRHGPLLFASRGIGGAAWLHSHCAVMHIGTICVRALTVRVHILPSPPRAAVMIPNLVNVPQPSLGHLRVLRLDVFDLGLAVPCWQCT